MSVDVSVRGYCPMGCGETLELSIRSGEIRCTHDECPQPNAVSVILADSETEHIVNVYDRSGRWNMKHPLRERFMGDLLDCRVGDTLSSLYLAPGRYRTKDGWEVERID